MAAEAAAEALLAAWLTAAARGALSLPSGGSTLLLRCLPAGLGLGAPVQLLRPPAGTSERVWLLETAPGLSGRAEATVVVTHLGVMRVPQRQVAPQAGCPDARGQR